jgi:hypothetical protein
MAGPGRNRPKKLYQDDSLLGRLPQEPRGFSAKPPFCYRLSLDQVLELSRWARLANVDESANLTGNCAFVAANYTTSSGGRAT